MSSTGGRRLEKDSSLLEEGYYRRLAHDQAAKLQVVSEKLAASFRDARRGRMVAKLVRAVYGLGDDHPVSDDVAPQFLQLIIEHMVCDRAVLLRRERNDSKRFVIVHALGLEMPAINEVLLNEPPAFFFMPGGSCPTSVFEMLRATFSAGTLLWAIDRPTGLALLIAGQLNATIPQFFETADREIIESALSVYVDILNKRRLNRLLLQAKQGADARDVSRVSMMWECLRLFSSCVDEVATLARQTLLVKGVIENKEVTDHILSIENSAENAAEVLRQTAEIIHVEDTPVALEVSWVLINDLLTSVIRSAYPSAITRGIDIVFLRSRQSLMACVDGVWIDVILKTLANQIIGNAAAGSQVTIESRRQSDGSVAIAMRWTNLDPGGSVAEPDLLFDPSGPIPSIDVMESVRRLIDSHGASLTFEANCACHNQVSLILSAFDCRDGGPADEGSGGESAFSL